MHIAYREWVLFLFPKMKVVSEDKKLVYSNIANKSQIGYYFALHKSWMGLKGPFISTPSFYSKEN